MLYEVTKLSSECSHVWRVSRTVSAHSHNIPQVLYSTLQKNDPARRCEHYSHVYTRDVTCELYCTILPMHLTQHARNFGKQGKVYNYKRADFLAPVADEDLLSTNNSQ